MPLIFCYGTLQEEHVQLSTFGRPLQGQGDEITDAELAAAERYEQLAASEGIARPPVDQRP